MVKKPIAAVTGRVDSLQQQERFITELERVNCTLLTDWFTFS